MVELDLYAIFQLDLSATEADIRTKYKKLALKHHPDRGGDGTILYSESTFLTVCSGCLSGTEQGV